MDMEFNFVLPMHNKDLLHSKGDAYYVKKVYSFEEIPEKLRECKNCVHCNVPFYMFDHFDTYFSIIECSNSGAAFDTMLSRCFDLLVVSTDQLGVQLTDFLPRTEGVTPQERQKYLNLTKMTIFLLVKIVCKIDRVRQQKLEAKQQNMQKKHFKQLEAELEHCYADWTKRRSRALVVLHDILQQNLEKLWSPPVVEEKFISLICDLYYRTLEAYQQRLDNRQLGETIFNTLGTAIKNYNHGRIFPVRILQILRNSESAAAAIASGVVLLVREYNTNTMIPHLFKDIVESLSVDSGDTAVSRNFSNFLKELARTEPKLVIPHLSLLGDDLLNCESHVLRNSLLEIMGDAIAHELSGENLDEELKDARDDFLERLLAHINDVSAHVRAKVLQIWDSLTVQEAVPIQFIPQVLTAAVERLDDKTSSVRKHAIQLMKSFLEHNPFSANLTLTQLKQNYNDESDRCDQLKDAVDAEQAKIEELDQNFVSIVPDLIAAIDLDFLENPEYNICDESMEDLARRVGSLLLEKKYREAVQLVRKIDVVGGNDAIVAAAQAEENDPTLLHQYYVSTLKSYMFNAQCNPELEERYATSLNLLKFHRDSIDFSDTLTRAVPKIQHLLLSKTNSDVFEAVEFFTAGFFFGIQGTEVGLRQMLLLLWHSDKEKSEAVIKAYKQMYFQTDKKDRAHAVVVIQNLTKFLQELNYSHYLCLEYLIKEWVRAEVIDIPLIQCLFDRFTMKLEGTTPNESRLALQLLIICSSANHLIACQNLEIIETIGFGERAKRDPRIFTACVQFMLNSIDPNINHQYYPRYAAENAIVQKVLQLFKAFFLNPKTPDFELMGTHTLMFFYKMCQAPDIIVKDLLFDILKDLCQFAPKTVEVTESQALEALESPYSQPIPGSSQPPSQRSSAVEIGIMQRQTPTLLLARFIFLIGQTIVREIIFLDMDVYNNLKYRQHLYDQQKRKLKNAFNQVVRRTTVNLNMSAMESLKRLSVSAAEPQQEPDEDLLGATAGDVHAELINQICETMLLHEGTALMTKIIPFIIEICKYPGKYNDAYLQQAATLCLIRFMCVSSQFCQTYMPFLMNILAQTQNIKIKCNIVQGLSDLTFRFPNIIEPWSGHFYSTLHEQNTELRLTAVKILSHLILHEMVRVKGQIADLAICIVDSVDEIRNLTLEFFKEIANKSSLYNVLPDIISKLSDPKLLLEEEKYRTIMRYILGLIQKDRHIETLVDKLCARFTITRQERQWRDTAFCLSLLNYNERSIKKLTDNVQHFKDKVQCDEVYNLFKQIITNTSKLAKPELKAACTEFEERLNACLEVHDPDAELSHTERLTQGSTNSTAKKQKGKKLPAKNANNRAGRRGARNQQSRRVNSSSSSSEESSSSSSDRNRNKARKAVGRVGKGKKPVTSSDDNESDSDVAPTPARGKNAQNKKAPNVRQVVLRDSTSISSDSEQRPLRKKGRRV